MGLTLALGVCAKPLTPGDALQRAEANGPSFMKGMKTAPRPVYTALTENGSPAAYIFNNAKSGYMIVAGDDVAYPLLGYSDSGSIDADNMPPQLRWWLSEYGRQIEWASQKGAGVAAAPAAPEDRVAVGPLLSSRWNQDAPFNNDCPESNGRKCYTGCVATSMAQVMYYFKYPEVGEGAVSYQCSSINRHLSLNFARKAFDWDNMINTYTRDNYTEEQADAVAYLMKACGYSVEMSYGTDASGASGADIAPALRNYFKYDGNISDYRRISFSGTQWNEMFYNNLKNVGPIVVNGQSPLEGGHSFVCDGYDGNGYFHFNWGWGGMSDGFFALDALNPEAQGIGGYAGGFNFQQNAIFGIQPPTGEPVNPQPSVILQYGNTSASISGRNLTFGVTDYSPLGWGNGCDHEIDMKFSAIIAPNNDAGDPISYVEASFGMISSVRLDSFYSYYSSETAKPIATLPDLADGEYRVTLGCYNTDGAVSESIPVAVPWGLQNSCIVKVENGAYTVTDIPVDNITVASLATASTLYAGKNVLLKAHFENRSDIELVKGICPALLDKNGRRVYSGESMLITLMPGESVEKEWLVKFLDPRTMQAASVTADTNFTMVLYDPETGLTYQNTDTEVTMQPDPGSTKIELTNFSIPGADRIEYDVNGQHLYAVWVVKDLAAIPFVYGFKVTKGYFDGIITLGIYEQDPTNPRNLMAVVDQVYSDMPFLLKGEDKETEITVDFSQGERDHVYYFVGKYIMDTRENDFAQMAFIYDPDGVDEIEAGVESGEVEIYNLQGVKVERPSEGEVVIVRQGSRTFKTIWR